jgi:hypothetical protein
MITDTPGKTFNFFLFAEAALDRSLAEACLNGDKGGLYADKT